MAAQGRGPNEAGEIDLNLPGWLGTFRDSIVSVPASRLFLSFLRIFGELSPGISGETHERTGSRLFDG
jgi:hypothetical protein